MIMMRLFISLTFISQLFSKDYISNPCIEHDHQHAQNLISCVSKYFLPRDSIHSIHQYEEMSLPTTDIYFLINQVWTKGCLQEKPQHIPAVLSEFIEIKSMNKGQYCLIIESKINKKYQRLVHGWPILIISNRPAFLQSVNITKNPESRHSKSKLEIKENFKSVHIQAPHPLFDVGTDNQVAHLFDVFPFKTLLISGRHRAAFASPTTCIPSTSFSRYWMTDPTHSNTEPFHQVSTMLNALDSGGTFIQFHGKGETTCPDLDVFLSGGLDTKSSSIYLSNPQWMVNKIYRNLQKEYHTHHNLTVDIPVSKLDSPIFSELNTSISSSTLTNSTQNHETSSCPLVAKKNLFGRLLNNVRLSNICHDETQPNKATGRFVHIEQSYTSIQCIQVWINLFQTLFNI